MIPAMAGLLGRALAWCVIVLAAAAVTLGVLAPRLAGGTPYGIASGSMRPHYPPGTLVVVTPVDVDRLAVGEAV